MNSPYRAHPALHSSTAPTGKTIPFPVGPLPKGHAKVTASSPAAKVPKADGSAKLIKLIKLEGDIRQQPTALALAFHAVNDARDLAGFRQGWFFRMNRRNRLVLQAVSDVPTVDLNAPLVLAVTRQANTIDITNGTQPVALAALQDGRYPHANGLLLPLKDSKGQVFAAILMARDESWPEPERNIAARLAETYGHALRAVTPPSLLRAPAVPRWALFAVPLAIAALAFVPVPMTALAPFEVVADKPAIIAAPSDGAIASLAADPNSIVKAGDLLFTLDDTRQKAEAQIAAQKVQVAESRLATARNGAFQDEALKRSLATAATELELARAEHAYAESVLARVQVRAEKSGLLIYSSRSEWMGKPVRTGEKVMEIADPLRVAYRLELAVHDSIVLADGATVRVFLDADPLHPRHARLVEAGYHAREMPGGALAYVMTALPMGEAPAVRIGLRGTAQVSGARVALGFYLLRRPIAALRQYFGR